MIESHFHFPTNYKSTSIFSIVTFKCNLACSFCLFRFNSVPDIPIRCQADKLSKMLKWCQENNRRTRVKITGGEPLLRDLSSILATIDEYDVEFIGLGSNSMSKLPEYFNNVRSPTNIYLSLHSLNELLGNTPKLTVSEFRGDITNDRIAFRVSCNLIKGQVDSVDDIQEYIHATKETDFICFRELNSISVDTNSLYDNFVYEYIDYRKTHLVSVGTILGSLSGDWKHIKTDDFGFILNSYYTYNGKTVLFRSMNEENLVSIAEDNPHRIDEIVIHPDGRITGCWDRDRKIIEKEVSQMPCRPFIPKPI